MKKISVFILLLTTSYLAKSQQFALFGTETIFDSFENPAQKSFTLDSSRKFSSNFLLPNYGINAANKGATNSVIRRLIQDGVYNTSDLELNTGNFNKLYQNSNIYIATFRIFKSYKYQKEMGFAWQIKSDANLKYTNDALAIFDTYKRFPTETPMHGIFNTKGYEQSYHQFSFNYRENYNKQLAFGFKASILSGIVYNDLDITDSYLVISPETNSMNIGINGSYYSNFIYTNELNKNNLIPTFKNPGLALSFGTSYKSKKGLTLMANVKDLGFIWWRSNTQKTIVNELKTIEDISGSRTQTNQQIKDIFLKSDQAKKFVAGTNAKVDVYVSKTFDFYKPALIVSKNLFYNGGDVALVNTFSYNDFSASVTPQYNFNNIFLLGLQGKYQTKNFEIFMGTDNSLKTASLLKDAIQNNTNFSNSNTGASFYMGVGIKFGNVVNHPQFSDVMPGLDDKQEGSFFKRLFSIFSF
jgi:hypothetical protein